MLTSAPLRGPEDSEHAADRHCCRPVKLRLGWLQPAIGGRSPDSLVVPSIQPRRCCKPLIISLSRCLFCDLLCPLECKYPFVPNVVSSVAWMFSSFYFTWSTRMYAGVHVLFCFFWCTKQMKADCPQFIRFSDNSV